MPRPALTLLFTFSVFAFAACDHGHDHNGDHSHDHPHEQPSDADGETRAYYGDEEPVTIESLPDDHHGHDHDGDHHGHDHEHNHDGHSHDH
ncbi:hypothetical protein [Marinimicrobium alkaliphilum]|uniref:hypothetical protein n=1 Tax=Marinimicrobium alkaliphilum TaxID=2202654 RepID=UPI000DB9D6D1|nr:hypothetical protein [Marinimicrobium alkaliphilum]